MAFVVTKNEEVQPKRVRLVEKMVRE